MFKLPVHFPPKAIRRIRHQAPRVSQLQSCQAELNLKVTSGATLLAWQGVGGITNPYAWATIHDINQILPWTTLEIEIWCASTTGGSPESQWNIPVEVPDASTTMQVANAVVLAVDTWVLHMTHLIPVLPDVASLRAVATPTVDPDVANVRLYMPWGMLGNPFVSSDGPNIGQPMCPPGNEGVDNPLVFGLIAKRRHVFGVRYPYRDDYYGDVQIG
jgi:hypothetical protein